jgi:DinB superfamily
MDGRADIVISQLKEVAVDASKTFGGLTGEQLNWKPGEKSWSVAQCFDHLITTHSLYFPLFERLAAGGYKQGFLERIRPLSGFFGRFLIKSMRPENPKKMKTTAKAEPSKSEIGDDIIERYAEHQRQMIEHIKSVPAEIDAVRTIITSPLLGVVTYSLVDTYTILAVHSQRHLGQAKRVTEADGFPAH